VTGGVVDEVGFAGLVFAKLLGEFAESISDVSGVDVNGWIGFDLFSQRCDCDGEVEQLLAELLDLREIVGVAEGDFVEQADRVIGTGGELGVERGVECVDGDGYSV
jgi:hypothetical protein